MPELTRAQIAALIDARFPDNSIRQITEARLREVFHTLADSVLFIGEGGSVDPEEADPLTLHALFSGHSLVNIDMPVMVRRMVEAAATAQTLTAGPVDYSVIIGSPMTWRWDHNGEEQGVPGRTTLAAGDIGIFTITEAGPIEVHQPGAYDYGPLWYNLAVSSHRDAQVYLYSTWAELISGQPGAVIDGDSNDHLPWRWRPLTDISRWEAIANVVNAQQPAGARNMLIVPVGLALGRLYDEIALTGTLYELNSFQNLFTDTIHCTDIGNYFVALVQFACMYRRTPIGLPRILARENGGTFTAPSAALAARMQEIAWDVVRSYGRSGVAGAALAPNLTFATLSTDAPQVGVAISVPWHYATGWPAPTRSLSWRVDGGQVSTAASYTPAPVTASRALSCLVTVTNASGTDTLLLTAPEPIAPAQAAAGRVLFDGVNDYISNLPLPDSAAATVVLRIRLPVDMSQDSSITPWLRGFDGQRLLFSVTSLAGTEVVGVIVEPRGVNAAGWLSIMAAFDKTGGMSGGATARLWINGTQVAQAINPSTSNFDFGTRWGEQFLFRRYAGSELRVEAEVAWILNDAALDPATHWGDFFGSDGAFATLPSNGLVAGEIPNFYQRGTAAVWNSGVDINGVTYTMHGAVTDV